MNHNKHTKQEAVKIVISCAEKYHEELEGRSFLLLCTDKHKRVSSIELTFKKYNFLHLTGLRLNSLGDDRFIDVTANSFYERCLNHRLSLNDFEFSDDETTDKKLDVLPIMICKNLHVNEIGDYNGSKPKLYTEKIGGSVKACMGFTKNSANEYVPNTMLKEDVRDVSSNRKRVVAVFRKKPEETKYTEITYIAKNVDWDALHFPEDCSGLAEEIREQSLLHV